MEPIYVKIMVPSYSDHALSRLKMKKKKKKKNIAKS